MAIVSFLMSPVTQVESSLTAVETVALQSIRSRVDAAFGEGWGWGRGTTEQVAEQGDGICDVQQAIIVTVDGVLAGGSDADEQHFEGVDGIGDIDRPIGVDIATAQQWRLASIDHSIIISIQVDQLEYEQAVTDVADEDAIIAEEGIDPPGAVVSGQGRLWVGVVSGHPVEPAAIGIDIEDLQPRLEPGVVDPISDHSLVMNAEGGGLREVDLVDDVEAHRTIGIVCHLIDLDATAEAFLAGDDKFAIGGRPARMSADARATAQ